MKQTKTVKSDLNKYLISYSYRQGSSFSDKVDTVFDNSIVAWKSLTEENIKEFLLHKRNNHIGHCMDFVILSIVKLDE